MSQPYVGQIYMTGYTFTMHNFAACTGLTVSVNDYTALFSLIGTTYGGDGRSTFQLPDLRGRVPIGQKQGPGLTNRAMGQMLGTETVALTEQEMPPHSHIVSATNDAGETQIPTGTVPATASQPIYSESSPATALYANTVSSYGDGQGHDNVAPSLPITFQICLTGVFPSRT